MSDIGFVTVERADHIALITIQRPDKLNALSSAVLRDLAVAFQALLDPTPGGTETEQVRAAVLTGAGRAFVAGADIAEMAAMTSAEALRFAASGHRLCALIEEAPFPVIAAVNGAALGGGCEIALACDFIYAAEGAKLGQPEVNLGVIPGFGGTQRLARRVGVARARELVYTGGIITAEQALTIGLVNAVHPAADLLQRARDTALEIASRGPLAVSAAKRVILRGEEADLPAANELEAQAFAALFGSEDQRAGMKAFLEKGKAVFTGR